MQKLLIFHKTIAPYRIDFFNDLYNRFEAKIVLDYKNLKDQKFDYNKILQQLNYDPEYLRIWFKIGKREFYKGYKNIIGAFNPDIVMANEFGLNLWSAIALNFIRKRKYKVVTVCDDSIEIARTCRGARRLARNLAMKFIDGIILCNKDAEDWYNEKFPEIKTYVFPIIHNEESIQRKIKESYDMVPALIEKYGLEGYKVFGFVGRIAPEKNLQYLIKSFANACRVHRDIKLLIVGDAVANNQKYKNEILDSIKRLKCDSIILCGRKEGKELYAHYNCTQALILPSISEPFGAVTGEALSAGCYVMVSDKAGSSCLVDGENGEILDISEPCIDFENMVNRLEAVCLDWKPRESKLKVTYDLRMNGLTEWLIFI